jgi:hypothetical protein
VAGALEAQLDSAASNGVLQGARMVLGITSSHYVGINTSLIAEGRADELTEELSCEN